MRVFHESYIFGLLLKDITRLNLEYNLIETKIFMQFSYSVDCIKKDSTTFNFNQTVGDLYPTVSKK